MISSNVRIPEDIWDKIREFSYEDERSMNSEIIYIFKEYIKKREENKTNE